MPRFIFTTNLGEQAHGGTPHVPHPLEIPQFHALHHPNMAPHVVPPPPPPHARVGMPLFEFEESDQKIVKNVYQNEDTNAATVEMVYEGPREIQLLAFQVFDIDNDVLGIFNQKSASLPKVDIDSSQDKTKGDMPMTRNIARWENPVLDDNAKALFMKTYGEKGKSFIEILQGVPYEIGVVSTLLAYLKYIIATLGKQNNEEN